MGLFDLFNDVADNMDKSRQAREYIQYAKERVREGNDLYESAYNRVTSYAYETENELRRHMDYKKQIAKDLGESIGTALRDFEGFNIDAKTISAPSIRGTGIGLSGFESAVSSCIPHLNTPSLFNMFFTSDDYYKARRQYNEARQYKERMKMERDKLNNYKEKMSEMRSFIRAEKSELDSLTGKLQRMTKELKSGMKKSSFSIEEAQYLKGIHKIAESIVTLLSTEFLSDNFSINQRYQKVFSDIKNINRNLPCAPSITDSNTAVAVKRILDGTIVN